MKKPRVPFGSIYPRGKKGTFYFENRKRGVNPTSLKTNDPDQAMERALELFGYLGHQDERKQQEKLLQQFQQANTRLIHSTSSIPLKDIEDEYLKVIKRIGKSKGELHTDASVEVPLSPTTLRSKFGCIRHFQTWLKENFPKLHCMHEVTPAITDRYFDELRGIRSASTYNNYRAYLSVTWERLAIRAGIEKNPFDAIKRLPASILNKEQFSKRPFTLKELKKIFKKAENTVWEPVCRLGYETGLRLGDICMLRREQLDLEDGFLDLRKIRTRKSGKEHLFFIPNSQEYLAKWLSTQPPEQEFVFPILAGIYERPSGSTNISARFQVFLTGDCKVETKVKDTNGSLHTVYGFHSFRTAHATHKRSGGADVKAVQSQLGHSNQQTTKGYIQEDDDALKRRLVTEHHALPMAGGNVRDTLVKQFSTAFLNLNARDQKAVQKQILSLFATTFEG